MTRLNVLSFVVVCGALGVLLAGTAQSQGGVKNLVFLQASTPGIQQAGHVNVSGTVRGGAGSFSGNSGNAIFNVTNANARGIVVDSGGGPAFGGFASGIEVRGGGGFRNGLIVNMAGIDPFACGIGSFLSGTGIAVCAVNSGGTAIEAVGRSNMIGPINVFHSGASIANIDFNEDLGQKISLWGTSETANYGFGIQGGLLQIHTGGVGDSIVFGYGGSSAFTETMRISGQGIVSLNGATPDLSSRITVNGNVTLVPASPFAIVGSVRSSWDLNAVKDIDSNQADAWFRWFTDNGTFEQMRILDGDESNILGDGTFVSNGVDYAEAFKITDDSIEAGEVVSIMPGQPDYIQRTTKLRDPQVVGIVSTKPGFLTGLSFNAENAIDPDLAAARDEARRKGDHRTEKELTKRLRELAEKAHRPVAFMGRVPCKVVGTIQPGDFLCASDVDGRATKLTQPGHSLGIALEPSNGAIDTILILVMPRHVGLESIGNQLDSGPSEVEALKKENADLKQQMADLLRRMEKLEASR